MPGPSVLRISKWTRRLGQHSDKNITAWPAELPAPTTATSDLIVEIGLDHGAGVIDAGPLETLGAGGFELAPADAGGDEDDAAFDLGAAIEMQGVLAATLAGRRDSLDRNGGDDPGTELEQLQHAPGGQVGTGQTGRKADEVFDARRAACLPARPEPIEQQGRKPFGGGIDGGGDAGGSGTDDGQVDGLVGTMPPDAGPVGQFAQARD